MSHRPDIDKSIYNNKDSDQVNMYDQQIPKYQDIYLYNMIFTCTSIYDKINISPIQRSLASEFIFQQTLSLPIYLNIYYLQCSKVSTVVYIRVRYNEEKRDNWEIIYIHKPTQYQNIQQKWLKKCITFSIQEYIHLTQHPFTNPIKAYGQSRDYRKEFKDIYLIYSKFCIKYQIQCKYNCTIYLPWRIQLIQELAIQYKEILKNYTILQKISNNNTTIDGWPNICSQKEMLDKDYYSENCNKRYKSNDDMYLQYSKVLEKRQKQYRIQPLFLYRYQKQTCSKRATILSWLAYVSYILGFSRDTYHTAVYFFDLYLSRNFDILQRIETSSLTSSNIKKLYMRIDDQNIRIFGIACLYISSKILETKVPAIISYIQQASIYGKVTIADMLAMERIVIYTLQWKLHPPTILVFIKLYLYLIVKKTEKLYTQYYKKKYISYNHPTYTEYMYSSVFLQYIQLFDNINYQSNDAWYKEHDKVSSTSSSSNINTTVFIPPPYIFQISYRWYRLMELLDTIILDSEYVFFSPNILALALLYIIHPEIQYLFPCFFRCSTILFAILFILRFTTLPYSGTDNISLHPETTSTNKYNLQHYNVQSLQFTLNILYNSYRFTHVASNTSLRMLVAKSMMVTR